MADSERLLAELAKIPGGATAYQLSSQLGLGPEAGRETSQLLRRLVEQGLVLETRPGRYQVSGAGGEHSVMVEAAEGEPDERGRPRLVARFGDEKVLPIHPRHTIGARAGDIAQAAIGEDEQVLITRILRRSGRELVGTVNFRPQGLVFIPDNRREGDMPVLSSFRTFEQEYRAGDRVVALIEIDEDGRAGVHVTSILGDETPEVADFRYVRLGHDLPGEFAEDVEAAARAFESVLPLGRREDLRKELVFTIDPATAKDFDDAISLRPRANGGWQLGVHIADVSHYVREGEVIDNEAAARGTSIYLINRVIPMLPEVLSNGLCSLVPDQDRYCLSAFLDLDKDGRLVGSRFAETMIRSRHRLTYEQALAVLEDRDPGMAMPSDLRQALVTVSDIAQKLRRGREAAGAINLYSVEHRFKLDVNGLPVEVARESSDIAHQLIEECMLLANRAVAHWLVQKGFPCVFRLHAPPDEERMKQFAGVVEAYGLDPGDVTTRGGLQHLLKRLSEEPPAARLVLNFMCLRSFKKAVYGTENTGHYALAFEHYAHFTSPIRRYPDLIVHRLVKRALKLPDYKDVEIRPGYLEPMAKQSSYLEQRAEAAERTLHARKSARYLSTRLGEEFPAVVTGATGGALFAQLMETGMEGIVPVRELGDDFYEFDPERLALVGRRSGRVFGPGTEVDIRVVSVDIERSDVVLGLAGQAARPSRGRDDRDRRRGRDDDRRGRRGRSRDDRDQPVEPDDDEDEGKETPPPTQPPAAQPSQPARGRDDAGSRGRSGTASHSRGGTGSHHRDEAAARGRDSRAGEDAARGAGHGSRGRPAVRGDDAARRDQPRRDEPQRGRQGEGDQSRYDKLPSSFWERVARRKRDDRDIGKQPERKGRGPKRR